MTHIRLAQVIPTVQGFLSKKESGPFGGYTKRFWKIDQQELCLYYYLGDDPDSLDKPCNFFKILEVSAEEGKKDDEFVLKTIEGEFVLKAGSEEAKREWIRSIFLLKKKTLAAKKLKQKGSDMLTATKSTKSPNKTNKTTRTKIISSIEVRTEVLPVNYESLHQIELTNYIKFMDTNTVLHNILSGNLHMVKKGLLFELKPRFLILFSSKSLYPDKYVSQQFLQNTQLPPWMQINCLYSVDLSNNKKTKLFHVKQILEMVNQEDQKKNQLQFSLRLNTANSTHQIVFSMLALRDRWRELLGVAIKNAEAVEKDGGLIKKNIDKVLKEFSMKILQKHLDEFYEEIRPKEYNFDQLCLFVKRVQTEMEDTREAALAREPPELALIKFYFDYFHQKVFLEMKLCWDSHFDQFGTLQLVQLLHLVDNYRQKIKQQVQDSRFDRGIKTVLHIFGRRTFASLKGIISAIAQADKVDNFFEQQDIVFTHSIVDAFKCLKDSFNIYYGEYSCKAITRVLAYITGNSLWLYLQSIRGDIDENWLSEQQLAALSNNAIWFSKFLKEFIEQKLVGSGVDPSDADTLSKRQKLLKQNVEVSSIPRSKLCGVITAIVSKLYASKRYHLITLDSVIDKINEHLSSVNLLHEINKRALWKQLLEFLITEIVGAIAACVAEKRKDHREQVVAKLQQELEFIREEFNGMTTQTVLKLNTHRIESILTILTTTDPDTLMNTIKLQQLKPIAKFSVLKKLVQYRNDLSLGAYKYVSSEVKLLADDDDGGQLASRRKMRQTIVMNLSAEPDGAPDEQQDEQDYDQEDDQDDEVDIPVITEGYMQKKKTDKKFWEKRYFRMIKGALYWYQDKTSSISQNNIQFNAVTDVFPADSEKHIFHIKCGQQGTAGKEYQFQCEKRQERDGWMATIIRQIRRTKEVYRPAYEPTRIQDKATLFVDYEAMMMDGEDQFGEMPEEPKSPARSPRKQKQGQSPFMLTKKESNRVKKEQALSPSTRLKEWKDSHLTPLNTGSKIQKPPESPKRK